MEKDVVYTHIYTIEYYSAKKKWMKGFPGGPMVKNPPVNTGDTGSIPGQGRFHMPWSN